MFIPSAKQIKELITAEVECTSEYERIIRRIFNTVKKHYSCDVSYIELGEKDKLDDKDVEKIMIYFDYKEYVVTRRFGINKVPMGFKISLLE